MSYIGKDVIHYGCGLVLNPEQAWKSISHAARKNIKKASELNIEVKKCTEAKSELEALRSIWYHPQDPNFPTSLAANDLMYLAYHGGRLIEDMLQEYSFCFIKKALDEKNPKVLELGLGDGLITRNLLKHGCQLTVVEGSEILVKKAQADFKGQPVRFVHSLFEEFRPQEKFDCVLANHVLEHVDHPVQVLKNIRLWLKPGGKLFAIVPNADSLHRRLGVYMGLQTRTDALGARDIQVGHQRVYNHSLLEAHLKVAGFEIEESGGYFLKLFSNAMMVNFDPKLIMAFLEVSQKFPKEALGNLYVVAT